jgi:hypothetical protein
MQSIGVLIRNGGRKPPMATFSHQGRREEEVFEPNNHWNVMSRHFEMSEPRPEEMVMQPRTFCAVVSAAQTA